MRFFFSLVSMPNNKVGASSASRSPARNWGIIMLAMSKRTICKNVMKLIQND